MGQKVNPTGFRVGITEDWKSKWYAPKAAYGTFLVEDYKVRRVIDAKLNRRPPFAAVSDILIERTREEVTITLKTARPGLVIGHKGAEVDKLREELEDMIHRKVGIYRGMYGGENMVSETDVRPGGPIRRGRR